MGSQAENEGFSIEALRRMRQRLENQTSEETRLTLVPPWLWDMTTEEDRRQVERYLHVKMVRCDKVFDPRSEQQEDSK